MFLFTAFIQRMKLHLSYHQYWEMFVLPVHYMGSVLRLSHLQAYTLRVIHQLIMLILQNVYGATFIFNQKRNLLNRFFFL